MISIGAIEALWIGVNALTLGLTVAALLDAWHDLRIVTGADRRKARTLTARGNVRREVIRVVVQFIFLGLALPAVFSDREITLTPFLVAFIAIPVLLLISTLFDTRDRNRLASMLLTDIATERAETALETSVQENIELTKTVGEKADAAYQEANHVNLKLVELTKLIGGKEDKA